MDKMYAIDANILITANRRIYPFDIAPAFWRQLIAKGSDRLILVDRVRDEILRNEDQLAKWLKENANLMSLRLSADLNVVQSYRRIINSVVENPQYKEAAKTEFAGVADSWLCAHALTYSYTVVTEEIHEPGSKRKVKIPNVCKEFSIEYINTIQFIRELGIKFV